MYMFTFIYRAKQINMLPKMYILLYNDQVPLIILFTIYMYMIDSLSVNMKNGLTLW